MAKQSHTAQSGPNAMRRAMLTAGPALALAPATALAGDPATPDTLIERLFWQWCDAHDTTEFCPQGNMTADEHEAVTDHLLDQEDALKDRIFAATATCERDLLLKIYLCGVNHAFDIDSELTQFGGEIRAMVGTTDRYEAHERFHEARRAAFAAREASA